MRIAVVGVGGLGGYFGGKLAHAGNDVAFVARGAHLAALREGGLTVKSVHGDFRVPARATDDPASVGAVDLVLFLVKTYDTDAAAAAARPLVGEATAVLSLQNGVDNAERIRRAIGRGRVIGGLAYIESAIEEPGVIAQRSRLQRVVIGAFDRAGASAAERAVAAFAAAGLDASLSADIEADLWTKWLFICATSGITTLCRQPIGPILATPETRALYEGVMREVEAVGRARGVRLAADAVAGGIRTAESFAPETRSSMLRDAERGAPLEIDALNGRVAAYGRETGVPTPVNAFVYAALLPGHRAATAARRV